jgi:DNA-directed RNA polymerase subunit RPC12/RpoP
VDDADSIIKFRCKNCGRKFSVHKNKAGKKGKCPKCKNIVIVPELDSANSTLRQGDLEDSKINSKYSAYDLSLLDIPQKNETQYQQTSQYKASGKVIRQPQKLKEEPAEGKNEFVSKRKFSWPVDMLLYPTSKGGLSTIAVIFLLRLSIDILTLFLICCFFGGILGLIAKILIVYSYMYWYFSECIRDSAAGGVRAPETMGNMSGLDEMFGQFVRLFACYAFTLGPVTFYRSYTYFYEIEMNRILFFGLSIMFYIFRAIMVPIMYKSGVISYMFSAYITFHIFTIYTVLILGHLLGRFYWRYNEKLNWEV